MAGNKSDFFPHPNNEGSIWGVLTHFSSTDSESVRHPGDLWCVISGVIFLLFFLQGK